MENEMRNELHEMAAYLQAKDISGEHEDLIDFARFTAQVSPLSETAYDVKEQMLEALREC